MQGPWRRFNEVVDDPTVVRQLHDEGCGAARAEMLLRDRGIVVDQLFIAARMRLPCTGGGLAARLTELSGGRHRWLGGELDIEAPAAADGFAPLAARGNWAAMLIPKKQRHGHWVVVDAVLSELVEVRDPVGSRYYLDFHDSRSDALHGGRVRARGKPMNIEITEVRPSDDRHISDVPSGDTVRDTVLLKVNDAPMLFEVVIQVRPMPGFEASVLNGDERLEELLRYEPEALAELLSVVGKIRRQQRVALPAPLVARDEPGQSRWAMATG
jgi:hypothetical protein